MIYCPNRQMVKLPFHIILKKELPNDYPINVWSRFTISITGKIKLLEINENENPSQSESYFVLS